MTISLLCRSGTSMSAAPQHCAAARGAVVSYRAVGPFNHAVFAGGMLIGPAARQLSIATGISENTQTPAPIRRGVFSHCRFSINRCGVPQTGALCRRRFTGVSSLVDNAPLDPAAHDRRGLSRASGQQAERHVGDARQQHTAPSVQPVGDAADGAGYQQDRRPVHRVYAALDCRLWSACMPSSISLLIASPWLLIRFENIQSSRACTCSAVVRNWTRSSFLDLICMSLMPPKVCAIRPSCNMLMLLDLLMSACDRLNLLMFSSLTDEVSWP